jgi:prevent-host-death family protein
MSKLGSVVGAYDAKTHLAELLERVQHGEEITITRHGSPIARLVPVDKTFTATDRRAALEAMNVIAQRNRLRRLRIKDLMNEGRR